MSVDLLILLPFRFQKAFISYQGSLANLSLSLCFLFYWSVKSVVVISIFVSVDLSRSDSPLRNPPVSFSLSTLHLPNENEKARPRKVEVEETYS